MKRSLLFISLMIVFGLTTTAGATLIGNSDGTITQVLGDTTLIWSQLDGGSFRGIWDQASQRVGEIGYELPGFELYSEFRNELSGYSGGANGGDPLPFFIGLGRYWTDFDPGDSNFAMYFNFLNGQNIVNGKFSPYNALAVKVVNNSADPVPEPGTILLLGSGLVGLAIYRRKTLRGGK